MSAQIINLRRARKARVRDEKDKGADANRIRHGAPKDIRDLAKARTEKDRRDLDAHKKE